MVSRFSSNLLSASMIPLKKLAASFSKILGFSYFGLKLSNSASSSFSLATLCGDFSASFKDFEGELFTRLEKADLYLGKVF